MSLWNLIKHYSTQMTPQSAQIPNSAVPQVKNSAGGFVWAVDDWTRLDRFLILGSEGGSYYASERALTVEGGEAVLRCIRADGLRTVARIAELSSSGRAPKNDPAIFALAMALKLGDDQTRRLAAEAVPVVCRIGTHLFSLAAAVKAFGGWGRGTQRAFGDWYANMEPNRLAYQAVKYQQRNGWSNRDLLRLAHVKPPSSEHDDIFRWMVKGWTGDLPDQAPDDATRGIWAFERAKRAETADEIVRLVTDFDLTREAIPTPFLNSTSVWEALLVSGRGMPMTAMIRSLAKMTAVGVLAPMSEGVKTVIERLSSEEALRKARVHPLALLTAMQTYKSGRGVRGKLTWRAVPQIVDALDGAFYTSFGTIPSTGKRWLLGLDVSGSMGCGVIAGLPGITPRVGAAAMAMVTARTESQYTVMAFQSSFTALSISPRERLDAVLGKTARLPFGATDCSLPMTWAMKNRIPVDVFAVYTDSETWAGKIHPVQALAKYRQKMGIPAKLIVVGMVANKFTIADPNDAGMLDVVGFDTAAPVVMSDFAKT